MRKGCSGLVLSSPLENELRQHSNCPSQTNANKQTRFQVFEKQQVVHELTVAETWQQIRFIEPRNCSHSYSISDIACQKPERAPKQLRQENALRFAVRKK
eukprot:5114820-Amphidinium_carterae.1